MTKKKDLEPWEPDFFSEIEDHDKKIALKELREVYFSTSDAWKREFSSKNEGERVSFLSFLSSPEILEDLKSRLNVLGISKNLTDQVEKIILGAEFLNDYGESVPDFDALFSEIIIPRDEDPRQNDTEKDPEEARTISDYLKKTSIDNALDSLKSTIETSQQGFSRVWATGFHFLDDKLDGGLHPKRLILIGAISSLGKTSLALQIADNVARSGKDVLVFSLEMDSDELLSKSISRETYLLSCGDKQKEKHRLTTQDILSGRVGSPGDEKRTLFDRAYDNVRKLNEHLFYYIGENDVSVDTVREVVEIHKRARNSAPLVIVDYLQILQTSKDALERRLDKRLLTDDDVTKLKVIARVLEVPVIVISAFNRESYLFPVSMTSFRESSGIEYSSDVLLGLQYAGSGYAKKRTRDKDGNLTTRFEGTEEHKARVRELAEKMDKSDVRSLELRILKNRNGKKGSVFFDFVAPYNYFKETGTDESIADIEKYVSDENPFEDPDEDADAFVDL